MNEATDQARSSISISGVLVHARPERLDAVCARLAAMPGLDIHATTPEGRLVVTLDESHDPMKGESLMRLHEIEGVLSASMIYHHYEPDVAEQEI